MSNTKSHDSDLTSVLKNDGVDVVAMDMENQPTACLGELTERLGTGSWAARLVYNDRFGGVIIRQHPGEGNRLHYHPDADECWVIMAGKWDWFIDGEGTKTVSVNDIVVVRQGVKHKITCVGDEPAVRFAITAPDVNHTYAEE
jgi:mannose-6-phosphate isomerase-like protein (cupin superfamily)